MFSSYTAKSISSRDNLLNQNKLRVIRKILICSSIKLSVWQGLILGSCFRQALTAQAFLHWRHGMSLLLGLLQTEACPLFPKTSLVFIGCLETLSHLWILLKTSQTLFESNTIWFVFIFVFIAEDWDRDRNCPWFQTLLCHRPVFKDLWKTLLLPCQPSILKNDQSNFFFQ